MAVTENELKRSYSGDCRWYQKPMYCAMLCWKCFAWNRALVRKSVCHSEQHCRSTTDNNSSLQQFLLYTWAYNTYIIITIMGYIYECAVPDRVFPFGPIYGDKQLSFDDPDDGYAQIALQQSFLFGSQSYDSLYVSLASCVWILFLKFHIFRQHTYMHVFFRLEAQKRLRKGYKIFRIDV